jgi:hypothetical protein
VVIWPLAGRSGVQLLQDTYRRVIIDEVQDLRVRW